MAKCLKAQRATHPSAKRRTGSHGIPAKIAVADFVRQLKANTSKHINEEQDSRLKFHWQDGYGAFTVSPSKVDAVVAYIDGQLEHHRKRTFQEEYLKMLADHEVEYDPKYLWE